MRVFGLYPEQSLLAKQGLYACTKDNCSPCKGNKCIETCETSASKCIETSASPVIPKLKIIA